MKLFYFLILSLGMAFVVNADEVSQRLQDISVTVNSGGSQGSGTIVTRELKVSEKGKEKETVNFVLTAAHVVDNLRKTRKVIDNKGVEKTVIEFGPAFVIKELVENGRRVGETKMEAKVLKYSDADNGHDIALLMVYKRNFISPSAHFYLDKDIPDLGTKLIHIGSLRGQFGANSMTTGIVSQIGRVLNLNGANNVLFDQTTVTAMPGSSGGGVFLEDGRYMGMLVRGASDTFNFIIPIRRMGEWAEANDLMWVFDDKMPTPTLETVLKMQCVEDAPIGLQFDRAAARPTVR